MSIQFSSIRPIEKTLSGATIQSHSGHGRIGNEGILRIFLRSRNTAGAPTDCLVSYLRDLLVVWGLLPLCLLSKETMLVVYLLTKWVLCSPMVRQTGVQSQVASYQRLKKWHLIPPWWTLSNIRYVSRVKWSNPGKGVAPSPYISV